MSAHTPGPWKAGARTVTAPETEGRLPLSVQINGGNQKDNRANARLIAAAPELLAACKAALAEFEECLDTHPIECGLYETLQAAIAKAEGR